MYTRFRIQNFKGFRDLEFDDLARINLLAGKNNTGKTSVLEALLLHTGNYDFDTVLHATADFPASKSRVAKLDWDSIFTDYDTQQEIVIDGNFNHVRQYGKIPFLSSKVQLSWRKPNSSHALLIDRLSSIGTEEPDTSNTYILDIRPKLFEWANLAGQYHFYRCDIAIHRSIDVRECSDSGFVPSLFIDSNRRIHPDIDVNRFGEIEFSDNLALLTDAMKSIDSRVESVSAIPRNGVTSLYARVGQKRPIPILGMGEGMQRLTSILLAMGTLQDGIILIDEIENGFHTSTFSDVWRAIDQASKDFNVQVFATTHDYEVIAAAHKHFSTANVNGEGYPFRLHRLDRHVKTGELLRTTYSPESLETSIEAGWEVR
jgi:hypothetical protein